MDSKRCTNANCLNKNVLQPLENFNKTDYGYDFYCKSCRNDEFELTHKVCSCVSCSWNGKKQPVKNFYVTRNKKVVDKYDYYCKKCRKQATQKGKQHDY